MNVTKEWRMRSVKRLMLVLLLLLLSVLAVACGPSEPTVEEEEQPAATEAPAEEELAEEELAEEEPAEEEAAMEEEKPDEITVAYFLEWPTPNQVAQLEESYDEVMGVKVNWVSFDTGTAMSAAMASGDVQIAYSQGLVPFANAVTAGLPLQLVGIAVSYAENDNCVAATSAGITAENATDLEGQKVAVPIGTVAHYKMLREMEHLGVDIGKLKLVDLAPADGAAALQRGDVAMACGWGGALARMKDNGNILMTGAEMEEIGIKVFDVVSVTDDFAQKYPSLVTAFLQVTEDANAAYAADPTANEQTIADAAGMVLAASNDVLATFSFPDKEAQLSKDWMGGTVQAFIKEVADFFVEQGELEESLDSYDGFIDTSFLEQVE
jgi:taurine transport system substrate-binding protein